MGRTFTDKAAKAAMERLGARYIELRGRSIKLHLAGNPGHADIALARGALSAFDTVSEVWIHLGQDPTTLPVIEVQYRKNITENDQNLIADLFHPQYRFTGRASAFIIRHKGKHVHTLMTITVEELTERQVRELAERLMEVGDVGEVDLDETLRQFVHGDAVFYFSPATHGKSYNYNSGVLAAAADGMEVYLVSCTVRDDDTRFRTSSRHNHPDERRRT